MKRPEEIDRNEQSAKYRKWLKRLWHKMLRRNKLYKPQYRGYSK